MIFVDTSVWSLALRRDVPPNIAEVHRFTQALERGEVVGSGMVLQELLQGTSGPAQPLALREAFRSISLVRPRIADHVDAAEVANRCRRGGVQITSVDALLATLCIRRGLPMLTTDQDFTHLARHAPLELWAP